MFIITLKFADKSKAPEHMPAHNAWIAEGFQTGHFKVVGSLAPNAGGALIATASSKDEIEAIVAKDPFVEHGVVSAEIIEISPNKFADGLEPFFT